MSKRRPKQHPVPPTHLMRHGSSRVLCVPPPGDRWYWYRYWAPGDPIGDDVCLECRRIAEGGDD